MKKKILTSVLALATANALSAPLVVPNTSFSSGTSISSSAMNANFAAIQSYMNGSVCLVDGTNCAYSGTVTAVATGTGLLGGPITTTGTLAVDVGTTASKIVQLNGSAQLPAVSGALLTNLDAGNIAAGTLPITRGGTGATTAATARANLGIPWDYVGLDIFYNGGDVGIGTSTPASLLHLSNTTTGTGLILATSQTGLNTGLHTEFKNGSGKIARIQPNGDSSPGGDLRFQTSQDGSTYYETLTLSKNAQVGIGTITPAYKQTIYSAATTGPASAYTQYVNSATGTSTFDGLVVGYGDNIAKFVNYENNSFSFQFGSSPVEKIYFTNAGDIYQTGSIFGISDERLKKDFAPLTNIFERLSAIRAYTYVMKADEKKVRQLGIKAQDVEKVFPELVKTRKDGYKSVTYAQLVAPLIDGVNELHKRVSNLEAPAVRSPASESRIKKLERENAQLKAWICAKDSSAPFCR